jgi:hypothetical protein
MDRRPDFPTVTAPARAVPEPFDHYPFGYESCTVECAPTADEQAAYAAFCRANRSAERFWERAPLADWMLDILGKLWDDLPAAPEAELRRFALRCVEGLRVAADPKVQELLGVVRRHLNGEATLDDLGAMQARTHRHVAQGGVQGLPRCSTFAAARLAAWHAADRDARSAASWCAEFAARHDAFVVLRQRAAGWHWPEDRGEPWREDWRAAFFAKAHPHLKAAAMAVARRRQADLLRSILPLPFGAPVRGEVYLGPADEAGIGPVYCMTCGFQRSDATPGVIFDVRGMLCKSCRAPVARCVH